MLHLNLHNVAVILMLLVAAAPGVLGQEGALWAISLALAEDLDCHLAMLHLNLRNVAVLLLLVVAVPGVAVQGTL